jgi:hypothetical protein
MRADRLAVRASALFVLAAAFVVPASSAARAQDLAAVARAEKERRAKLAAARASGAAAAKETPKVYSDEDAKKAQGSVTQIVGADATTPRGTAGSPEDDKPSDASTSGAPGPGAGEGVWRAALSDARKAVAAAEEGIRKTEAEIVRVREDREPNPPDALDPQRLPKRQARLQNLATQLESQKKALQSAQAALDSLLDAARRQNIPAGWLR